MALPITGNTTCDVYRSTNSPPAAPDVAGVSIVWGELTAQSKSRGVAKGVPSTITVRPGGSDVIVILLVWVAKLAVTVFGADMATLTGLAVPDTSPARFAKVKLAAAVAVS